MLLPRISPVPFLSSVAKEIPAAIASLGERICIVFPSIKISPVVQVAYFPTILSKTSERPAPARPAIPSTSPDLTLNEISFRERLKLPLGGVKLKFFTSRTTSPIFTFLFGY